MAAMQPTRHNPFQSKIKKRSLLNKGGSSKATYHIELESSPDLTFEPGDSIAILPHYCEAKVEPLNAYFGKREDLHNTYNLDTFSKKFLRALQDFEIQNSDMLSALLEDRDQCRAFIDEHTVLSALNYFKPQKIDVEALLASLSPILPRMYSIASSQLEHPNEIHLTVATFSYTKQGEVCTGLGSNFLCASAEVGVTSVPFYIHHSPKFKLPDHHHDLIMIGPGTGVAPYRAFLQERRAQEATGRHWLFFGERNRDTDFYYEDFFTKYQLPLKLDLAFSRDQEDKIYVQHKMRSNAKELWEWIDGGAHIYICGDAKRMARDVQDTLQHIIMDEGKQDESAAKTKLKEMRKSGQLRLDVY